MFEGIIGNEYAKQHLENSIKNNSITHSYMFSGKEGIGKKLIATEFAKNILCKTKEDIIKFESGSHPDFKLIEPEKENTFTIGQVRELQLKIIEKPINGEKKIFILNDAEKMNEEAQNCLLKTLEEPPEYAMIILIVSNETRMLPTIKSRCVIIKFNDLLKEDLMKKGVSEEIAEMLDGSFKNFEGIESMLEKYKEVENLLDAIERDTMIEVFKKASVFVDNKNIVINLLEYLNVLLFKRRLINEVSIVENTKKKIAQNNNYTMTIDYLVMSLYKSIRN